MRRWASKGGSSWLAAVLSCAGCGGQPDAPVPAVAAVDPRFASAEALLDHYNELTVDRPLIDPVALMDLMYAANELQERLLRMVRNFIPSVELDQAVWERFGEALTPRQRLGKPVETAPLAPNPRPAVFTENTGDRALAREFNADGTETRLYLVRVGDRWWVSGYGFEYRPEFTSTFADLDKGEQFLKRVGSVAAGITQRVRAGEFTSVDEVRKAFGVALIGAVP